VPDVRTIWDFKHTLERDGRDGALRVYERFDQILNGRGMIGREKSIVMPVLWRPRGSATTGGKTNKSIKEEDRKVLSKGVRRDAKKTAKVVWQRRTTRRIIDTRIT
jgi:hypothetical protein